MKPDFKQYIATEITAALIGGAMSAATALGGTAMRNSAQRRENQLAFEREKQQIKEQNAYNTPSAQMARMAAAGLNPNLMYQQGEQGLQTDSAHYTPAELESGVEPLGNIGSQVITDLVGIKDMENKTALAESQVLLNSSTAGFNIANTHFTKIQGKKVIELLGMEKEIMRTQAELNAAQKAVAEETVDKVRADKQASMARAGLDAAQASKISTEEAQIIALFPSKEAFLKADTEARRAMAAQAAAQIQYLSHKKIVDWVNVGLNAVSTTADVMAVASKWFNAGKSVADTFGASPFDELGKGGTGNDFQDFLAGD